MRRLTHSGRALIATVAAATLLVACSGEGSGSPDPSSLPPAPTVTDGASYEELVARVMQEQKDSLSSPSSMAPEGASLVDVVRIVDAQGWPTAQTSCLAEAGFSAQPIPGSGYEILGEIPPDQVEALRLASWSCKWQYPIDPRRNDSLDRGQAQALYAHLVDVTAPCIEQLGYRVPEPPSEDAWLASYLAAQERWDPVAAVATGLSSDAFDQIMEQCPAEPDGLYPAIPDPPD